MTTFKSSGDLGDICYSLPVIRHYGPGKLYIAAAGWTRQRLTPDKWACLAPLLRAQPYITEVEAWAGQPVDINLDDFRAKMFGVLRSPDSPFKMKSLCDWILETHGVPLSAKDNAWIDVPSVRFEAPVIFNRSTRYPNPMFNWPGIVKRYGQDAAFIGHQSEYNAFTRLFGEVRYVQTPDLLEAARVIQGAKLFVGNQSCCNAICEGIKQDSIVECWPGGMNCLIPRKNVIHGIGGMLYRPITE